jgi:hypothetical protein
MPTIRLGKGLIRSPLPNGSSSYGGCIAPSRWGQELPGSRRSFVCRRRRRTSVNERTDEQTGRPSRSWVLYVRSFGIVGTSGKTGLQRRVMRSSESHDRMIGGLKETGRGARTEVRTSCHHPNNKKEPLPDGYDRPDKPLRYCQAIMLARK